MKIEGYSISGPVSGLCKQHAVWGSKGNTSSPIIYLQRPKWIKDDDVWGKIVNSVSINLPLGFEIK